MNAKLKFAFLMSLVINVFFVGMLLGELPRRFDEGMSREERLAKATEAFPEPLRTQFRGKMDRMREGSEPIREQIREAREEAIRILAAEPFDGTAYDHQVRKIHELQGQRSQHMADLVKEVAKDLPPDQRQMLAEVLRGQPSSSSR